MVVRVVEITATPHLPPSASNVDIGYWNKD